MSKYVPGTIYRCTESKMTILVLPEDMSMIIHQGNSNIKIGYVGRICSMGKWNIRVFPKKWVQIMSHKHDMGV